MTSPLLAAVGEATGAVLAVLGLAATAYALGGTATRRLDAGSRGERAVLSLALGLALCAHLLLLLGFLGRLRPVPVLMVAIAVNAAAFAVWRELAADLRASRPRWALCAVGAVVLAPLFLLALYPPTAFDETSYHLPVARGFVQSGGVPYLADLRFPVFPHLNNLLFAAMLLATGETAAHLVQLLATVTTAGLLVAWGRRLGSTRAGWMAAALFLGYPIVVYLSGTAYLDAFFALLVAGGLFALERWRESGRAGWLVVACVLTASSAGTKYHGLFFVAAVLVLCAIDAPSGRKLRSLAIASAASLAVLAPWYGRILYHTGDLLFPAFSSATPWSMGRLGPTPWERLRALPTMPWDVIFRRDRMGSQPPFSPAFLLGLPLVATGALRDTRIRRLVALCVVYLVVLLFAPADARYLMPVIVVASLAVAAELAHWGDRLLGNRWHRPAIVSALCALLGLPGWLYAGYRIALQGPLPITERQREAYLTRRFPRTQRSPGSTTPAGAIPRYGRCAPRVSGTTPTDASWATGTARRATLASRRRLATRSRCTGCCGCWARPICWYPPAMRKGRRSLCLCPRTRRFAGGSTSFTRTPAAVSTRCTQPPSSVIVGERGDEASPDPRADAGRQPASYAPTASRIARSMRAACSSIVPSSGPSIMMRASGSVPL